MKHLLNDLKEFFAAEELPTYHIDLDGVTQITSPTAFVAGHLEMAEGTAENIATPYIERLVKFRKIILERRAKPY